ncbi:hypothetical protein M409DRAFT_27214 [Zasmidium cellare ATCC 36951]|uniref:AB hydrolase-1 domain-containing protein n=1 Tax=Zasmidium cellare ATCC 36951 TaxID=1080233 RepID=A0A6A6C6X8_ZASCE|nr:uncharacterized protein M409DRAFT_27214 [Zasmidium cellare ATCC 36951]KAF2162593.1 hypothetical protein M409DRAFT_27214 [Zasmidium cellare ATCC 36951]
MLKHLPGRPPQSSSTINNLSMPPSKPTLVFVHGGWHDPSCFDSVRVPLESAGYKCRVPALPSIGELSATKTSSDDVAVVHGIISDCVSKGEDVIVIGHSNGGLKANGALKGLVGPDSTVADSTGKILGLGIIAGLLPPVGKMGASAPAPQSHLSDNRWVFSETDPTMLPRDPTNLFYNDMSPEQAAYWTARIKPMHTQEMFGGYYEAWHHVPVSYLVTTKDNGISEAQQDAIINDAKAEGGIVFATHVEASHSPFLSVPDKVAAWIRRAAEEEFVTT